MNSHYDLVRDTYNCSTIVLRVNLASHLVLFKLFSLFLLSILIPSLACEGVTGTLSWLPNMKRVLSSRLIIDYQPHPPSAHSLSLLSSSLSILPPHFYHGLHHFPSSPAPEPAQVTHVKCSQHNTTLPITIIAHVYACYCLHHCVWTRLSVCLFKCLCLSIHLRPN